MKLKLFAIGTLSLLSVLSVGKSFTNVDAAFTPPTTYEVGWNRIPGVSYSYRSNSGLGPTSVALFNRYSIAGYLWYDHEFSDANSHTNQANFDLADGLNVLMAFGRSNTTWIDASPTYTGYYPSGNVTGVGSNSSVGTIDDKIQVKIENRTNDDYALWIDIDDSTTNTDWLLTLNTEPYFTIGGDETYLSVANINRVVVPAQSDVLFKATLTGTSRYLSAWYLENLGESYSIIQAYDDGFDDGVLGGNNMLDIMTTTFSGIANILSINILNNITLGTLALFPLLGIFLMFIKKLAQ
jgi:hypothetical protein